MLVKGIEEVGLAPRPLAAADMVLVRLCHAADLPTPDEAIRSLAGNGAAAPRRCRSVRRAIAPAQSARRLPARRRRRASSR